MTAINTVSGLMGLRSDGTPWPDPCTRWQPEGMRGPSRVLDTSAFAWTDTHLHEFRPWGERDGHPRFGMPLDDKPSPRTITLPCPVASTIAGRPAS